MQNWFPISHSQVFLVVLPTWLIAMLTNVLKNRFRGFLCCHFLQPVKKILNARISYFRGVICKSWNEILLFEKYFLILTSEVIDIFTYGGKFLFRRHGDAEQCCRCGWTKWARGSVKEKKTFTELLAQLKEFKFSIFWLSSIRSIPHVWQDLVKEGVY